MEGGNNAFVDSEKQNKRTAKEPCRKHLFYVRSHPIFGEAAAKETISSERGPLERLGGARYIVFIYEPETRRLRKYVAFNLQAFFSLFAPRVPVYFCYRRV